MSSLNDVLYPLAAIVVAAAFLWQVTRVITSQRDPGAIAMCVSFGCLAAVFTVSVPVVWVGVDRLLGVAQIAGLLAQSLVILFTAAQQAMLVLWSNPPARAWRTMRRRLAGVGVVLLIMAALFAVTPRGGDHSRDFAVHFAGIPTYAVYLIFYLTAFTVTKIDVIRMALRYAPLSGKVWLRRGLRLMAVGSALGLVYSAVRAADVIGPLLGADPRRWEFLAQVSTSMGAIIEVLGLTLVPRGGPQLSLAHDWWRQRRQYRRLRPLWFSLYQASPDIALEAPPSPLAERFILRDIRYLLTRRVIEIRDGALTLRGYRDPRVEAAALARASELGLKGEDLSAAVEAAALAAALRARDSDGEPVPSGQGTADAGKDTDMSLEIAWLVKVARAFAGDPVVAQARAGELMERLPETGNKAR
ncbi:hypothetical protein DQ384_34600 [Sphaerisporangium album]|uniref:DUF6545 domain-containing protein n=1 Tax=Sphaerisporangium album TaxID=509200 RepID=A0A367EX89_9ACTN|nr:MAB_1171c family putative transporter [Sphaerisporangium album]RCG22738.1 hypothetical protein DQ384_34600 [Sphaerisporangium album]